MTLRSRLLFSHSVVIALAMIAFVAALYSIDNLHGRVERIAQGRQGIIDSTERIRDEFSNVMRSVIEEGVSETRDRSRSVAAVNGLRGAIEASRKYFQAPEEKSAFDALQANFQAFADAVEGWSARTIEPADSAQRIAEAYSRLRIAAVQLRDLKIEQVNLAATQARDFTQMMMFLLAALALALLCVGIFTTLRLVRVVCFQVDSLTDVVDKMSHGEYDVSCGDASVVEFNLLGRHLENMGRQLSALRDTNVERVIAEQRRTSAVLDSIDDGLVIFSDQAVIERINAVAERQLGVEPGTAVGKRFEQIGDETIARHISQVLASGELIDVGRPELRIEHDNEVRIVAFSLHRFVESQSDRIGVVMVLRDVTVQHAFDKMRSEFVLRASHELRTPIASIRMGLSLLGEKMDFAEGSRERELYQTVQQEVTRMIGLLTDLLDLSRMRVGQQKFELAPTNIAEMLVDAGHRFELQAAASKLTLSVHVQEGLPHVPLSRSTFDRVFDNLIGNAMRHTAPGGSIGLSAELTRNTLLIRVADTGEGIPLAQQALIFQPFVQIGAKRGGAGLGLAICKEIVQLHGGTISIYSQPRRGTTFTISLPV
ncbi:MAG TPA: ATP-binding protein [Rudaea sp.]|jgi:NtrC-family two-component system sensor histidine kinase KinB|nr:ATP-binding protein [Rudaea sp.]